MNPNDICTLEELRDIIEGFIGLYDDVERELQPFELGRVTAFSTVLLLLDELEGNIQEENE